MQEKSSINGFRVLIHAGYFNTRAGKYEGAQPSVRQTGQDDLTGFIDVFSGCLRRDLRVIAEEIINSLKRNGPILRIAYDKHLLETCIHNRRMPNPLALYEQALVPYKGEKA